MPPPSSAGSTGAPAPRCRRSSPAGPGPLGALPCSGSGSKTGRNLDPGPREAKRIRFPRPGAFESAEQLAAAAAAADRCQRATAYLGLDLHGLHLFRIGHGFTANGLSDAATQRAARATAHLGLDLHGLHL